VADTLRDEPGAADRLIRASIPIVQRAVVGVGSREDQADAEQDAYELILGRLWQLREWAAYPGWAHRLARRAALRYVGGAATEPLTGEGPALAPADQQIVDRLSLGPVLREAMTVLSPRQRAVIDAVVLIEPWSYAASARELQCPVGSIGPVRKRALGRLRSVSSVVALVAD
jgi:DNA-directed RNA polymerase specialized sigma24 family protein